MPLEGTIQVGICLSFQETLEVDAAIGSRNAKPWLVIALFVIKIDFIDALKV